MCTTWLCSCWCHVTGRPRCVLELLLSDSFPADAVVCGEGKDEERGVGAGRPGAGGQCASSVSIYFYLFIIIAMPFLSHAKMKGEGLPNHALRKWGQLMHTHCANCRPTIRPQWHSEPRWLWTRVTWQVLRGLASRVGSKFPCCTWTAQSAHSDFVGSGGVCVLTCNLPPAP